jgi:hypothetical protein
MVQSGGRFVGIWNQWLRQQYKYMPDEEYSEDRYNAYVEAREKLFELMQENGVNLEDV